MMRGRAMGVVVAVVALVAAVGPGAAWGDPPSDLPRAAPVEPAVAPTVAPSRQVHLKADQPAPFEGELINAARAAEIAAGSATAQANAKCDTDLKICSAERDGWKAEAGKGGVAVGTVVGVVVVVGVTMAAVGVIAGAFAYARAAK